MGNIFHNLGNAITGRVDETTVYVRLLRSGNWVGPLDFNVIALTCGMMQDPNGGADLLSAAKKGDEVEVKMPTKISNNREWYTVCCLVDSVDTFVFAGVKRTTGNNRSTVYTMGRKEMKGYFANTWFKVPSEHSKFNQFYRQILESVYGIRSDAEDFYDQVVLAQEKYTGQKFLRNPSLGDDGDWHGKIQADPHADAKLSAKIDFRKIDHNGGQTFGNYASWYFLEKNGVYKIENCFMLNPDELKEYIDALYRQSDVVEEDAGRATMSFASLLTSIAMDFTTFCFARASNIPISKVELRDSVCALLVSLGLFDKKAIDTALKELFTKDGPKESESTNEIQRRYGASRPQEQQKNGEGQKKRTANRGGFGGKPKMEDGRQVEFEIIETAIEALEEDAAEGSGATNTQRLQYMNVLRALEKAMKTAKDTRKDTIGAPYLNWEIKNANPGVKKLELLDGSPVYFKTKVDEE